MRYVSVRRQIEGALPTVVELLRQRNESHAFDVMTEAEIELTVSGHDNWNGGTTIWTMYLRVPISVFLGVEDLRNEIEAKITENFELVVGKDKGFWLGCEISPMLMNSPGKVPSKSILTERTRVAIIDELRIRNTVWSGALDEVEFLNRIFDLNSMPSYDSRFDNAAEDIWQHCVNNEDWPVDWIYTDDRFRLHQLDQQYFLKFICELLHPLVRRNQVEQETLADIFNGHLRNDGWQLVEDVIVDGRPVYVAERRTHALGRSVDRIKAVAATLKSDSLYEDLQRLERVGDSEPGEAIALAKEIVESCCKLILDDRQVTYSDKADIPELLKLLRKEIKIMPDEIDENARGGREIRGILSSLGSIAHLLAPLRNVYGKGHGRGRGFRSLQPRHARLAIGAASTFVDFVLDRHLDQQKDLDVK